MNINIWIPSLFESKGGIQVYSAYFLDALRSILPKSHHSIFLKHDTTNQTPPIFNTTYFTSGHIPLRRRTPAFASQLIRSSLRHPPQPIVSTHLNLTLMMSRGSRKL
jgi:hypothetical protein